MQTIDPSGPRYTCLKCEDRGMVHVWNPVFVESFRTTFEEYERTCFPDTWQAEAYSWWLRQERGPMVHMARCNCHCRQSQVYADEIRKHNQGERKNKHGDPRGLPACGAAVYDPTRMPLKTPDAIGDLRKWYAEHAPNQSYEWNPN